MAQKVSKKTRSRRCYRCGLEKKGPTHEGGARRTSAEYCTSTVVQEGWTVPSGYEVGDDRPPATLKSIMQNWKQRKEALSIEDEFEFEGWT